MTAFTVVRFKVKPGMENAFLDAHRNIAENWPGLRHANIIAASEGRYCIIAEWDSMEALAAARPQMIATLDSFRQTLVDLGGGLGVTDPISGSVALSIK
jgi:antibiotic biosynthesis monooxygenase (ABM) superfamily enzyme